MAAQRQSISGQPTGSSRSLLRLRPFTGVSYPPSALWRLTKAGDHSNPAALSSKKLQQTPTDPPPPPR